MPTHTVARVRSTTTEKLTWSRWTSLNSSTELGTTICCRNCFRVPLGSLIVLPHWANYLYPSPWGSDSAAPYESWCSPTFCDCHPLLHSMCQWSSSHIFATIFTVLPVVTLRCSFFYPTACQTTINIDHDGIVLYAPLVSDPGPAMRLSTWQRIDKSNQNSMPYSTNKVVRCLIWRMTTIW